MLSPAGTIIIIISIEIAKADIINANFQLGLLSFNNFNRYRMAKMNNAIIEDITFTNTNLVIWGDSQIIPCKIADKAGTNFKDNFEIKTGLIEGKVADMETINAMAKLPDRDTLIGMLLNVWNAPVQNFTIGMDALSKKLEEEA